MILGFASIIIDHYLRSKELMTYLLFVEPMDTRNDDRRAL
jgi:hypothetical protein